MGQVTKKFEGLEFRIKVFMIWTWPFAYSNEKSRKTACCAKLGVYIKRIWGSLKKRALDFRLAIPGLEPHCFSGVC